MPGMESPHLESYFLANSIKPVCERKQRDAERWYVPGDLVSLGSRQSIDGQPIKGRLSMGHLTGAISRL